MTSIAEALKRLGERAGVSVALVEIDGGGRTNDRRAGEAAAAEALRAAGCARRSLLGHAGDGRPLWPAGFTGSIAHAGSIAVAAACPTSATTALGIDVELAASLPAVDAVAVLDARENALVAGRADGDALATLLWSAKESAFKAWSTATDGSLGKVDPVDLHVELDLEQARLSVTAHGALLVPTNAVGALDGAHETVDGYVLTLVTARREPGSMG